MASRKLYLHLTGAQKFKVGKRAAEFGTTNTLHYYAMHFPNLPLKETSVRQFKTQYLSEFNKKKTGAECSQDKVCDLLSKKLGRPLLIGEKLTGSYRSTYVTFMRLDQL